MNYFEPFKRLNEAIENNDSFAVGEAIAEIFNCRVNLSHLARPYYAGAVVAAIKNGNPDIFEQVCALQNSHLTYFEFNESRDIVAALHANTDRRIDQIFLSFLDNCPKHTRASLVFALYSNQDQTLIDQIRNDAPHENLRCVLARCAIEFNDTDLVWAIVQTTPQALPDLSECDPNTEKGQAWIDIYERYSVWRAHEEHAVLTTVTGSSHTPQLRKI